MRPYVTLTVVAGAMRPLLSTAFQWFVEGRFMVKVGIVGGTGYTGVEIAASVGSASAS